MKVILTLLLFIFVEFVASQVQQCNYVPNKGYSCNGFQPRTYYYYHVASKTCQPFVYYGCGGNANRFNTPTDCNNICKPGASIINGPNIGTGARPGNGNNSNQPPIGGGTNSNGNPPVGQGAVPQNQMNIGQGTIRQSQMNSRPVPQNQTNVGQGTAPQNPMNVGQGTAPQNPMNVGQGTAPQNSRPMTGQGVNPANPMMVGNGAMAVPSNGTLIGGNRPLPPGVGQGAVGATTMNPMFMETTTKEFINGYAQMCNTIFSVVINRPTVCGANDNCPIGYVCSGTYCCPTKSTVCSQRYDSGKELEGKELEHIGRYAFNPSTQQCSKFSYFGTEGNFNNFRSYNDCMQYCTGPN
ncbi:hypothetical protein FO519_007788 [Halicephalobus sp. NKZ332]|nr:hypothetical protein FO519_007788 [Halicephalobus sp. NKZ332]